MMALLDPLLLVVTPARKERQRRLPRMRSVRVPESVEQQVGEFGEGFRGGHAGACQQRAGLDGFDGEGDDLGGEGTTVGVARSTRMSLSWRSSTTWSSQPKSYWPGAGSSRAQEKIPTLTIVTPASRMSRMPSCQTLPATARGCSRAW